MNNSNKIILDLCGGTGSWGRPYKEAGYDYRLITLPDNDVLTYQPPANVYGILAAPPCTEFSLALQNRPRDLRIGMETITACQRIINEVLLHHYEQYKTFANFGFWALENPGKGYLSQFLGKPSYRFNPCDFGDHYTKLTYLWGNFNIPKSQMCFGLAIGAVEHSHAKDGLNRQAVRSITPPHFARAFYEANK